MCVYISSKSSHFFLASFSVVKPSLLLGASSISIDKRLWSESWGRLLGATKMWVAEISQTRFGQQARAYTASSRPRWLTG